MASQTQPITTTDVPNFNVGELFTIGVESDNARLISLAGLNGGWKVTDHTEIALSNTIGLDAGAQDGVTETRVECTAVLSPISALFALCTKFTLPAAPSSAGQRPL